MPAAATAPSASSAPSLNPPAELTQGVATTNACIPSVDAAVAGLLALPVPAADTLASLPSDVDKARADAARWTSTYRPLVLSSLQGVATFGATFDTAYDTLLPLAVRIAAGDASAIAPFQSVLEQLQAATRTTAQATAAVATQLVDYEALIDSDIATLNGDEATLQAQQAQYEQAANVAANAAEQVHEEIVQDEAQIAIAVVNGRYAYAELMETIDLLTGKEAQLRDQEATFEAQANTASAEAQDLGSTRLEVAQYQTFLGDLSSGLGALDEGWNTLDANFSELLSSEDITTYSIFTPALLQAVKADWDNLARQASLLLGLS